MRAPATEQINGLSSDEPFSFLCKGSAGVAVGTISDELHAMSLRRVAFATNAITRDVTARPLGLRVGPCWHRREQVTQATRNPSPDDCLTSLDHSNAKDVGSEEFFRQARRKGGRHFFAYPIIKPQGPAR